MENINMEGSTFQCPICIAAKSFSLPLEILEKCIKGDVVIFAGAGITTESRIVYQWKFYEDLKGLLKIPVKHNVSFTELSNLFVRTRGKEELLKKIKRRFDNVANFPELRRTATRFHRELSTVPFIQEIVTTNWDTYFEEECAALPVISGFKYIIASPHQRLVHKIHGSFSDLGSIIATTRDFKRQYELLRHHKIWSRLRNLLLSKTLIFIGYSFLDEEFLSFFRELRAKTSAVQEIYAVTLDSELFARTQGLTINVINTSGEHFLHMLKNELWNKKLLLHDSVYQFAYIQMRNILEEHKRLNSRYPMSKFPETLYCAYFQDGLIHAFERVLALRPSGYYSLSANIKGALSAYKTRLEKKLKNNNFQDVAYIDGYGWALSSLLTPKERVPKYYVYGLNSCIYNFEEYSKVRKKAKIIHPAAYELAQKLVSKLSNDGVIWHHPAYFISDD